LFRWIILPLLVLPLIGHASLHDSLSIDTSQSIFDILSQEEVLHISIKTDLNNLLVNKRSDKYQTANLYIPGQSAYPTRWNVNIKARGKHRRMTCDFPPMKIKFDKVELGNSNLSSTSTLKIVSHCSGQAENEELLLKEYLVYKMYNVLTPYSFRTQLIKINWEDTSGKYNIGVKWGFLIEHEDNIIERLACTSYDDRGAHHHQLNHQNAAIFYLFQYMVGNHDWALLTGQNICFIRSLDSGEELAIPYDFDFSMLVNAYYMVLDWELSGPNKRMYLGNLTDAENEETIELFQSKKKEIFDLIDSFKKLSKGSRQKATKYIESFYNSLDEPLRRQTNN